MTNENTYLIYTQKRYDTYVYFSNDLHMGLDIAVHLETHSGN